MGWKVNPFGTPVAWEEMARGAPSSRFVEEPRCLAGGSKGRHCVCNWGSPVSMSTINKISVLGDRGWGKAEKNALKPANRTCLLLGLQFTLSAVTGANFAPILLFLSDGLFWGSKWIPAAWTYLFPWGCKVHLTIMGTGGRERQCGEKQTRDSRFV